MSNESALPATGSIQATEFKEGLVTLLLGITVILVVMNTMMFNLALPEVSKEFGLSATSASWIVTGYSIVFAISSITYSRLSDFLPIRTLLTVGLVSLGAASILGFFSHHFILLLCARLIQASGAASVPALGIVLITRFVPLSRRGKAMSVVMSASSLGLGLGPVIGGAAVQYLGWNSLFAITGIVLLLIPMFFHLLPKEPAQKVSFDLAGAVLIGIGTTGMLLFLTSRLWIALAAGLVSLVLFWLRIHRAEAPFVQPALFRSKPYMALSTLGIVSYINSFAALFLLPQILAHHYGLSPGQSGLVIFPGALLAMLASSRIGKIIDRYGNAGLLRNVPWLLLAAAVLFAIFAGWSFYAIMIIYMLLSVSFSALTSSVSNEMSRLLPKEQIGSGMGLFQLTQFFSGAFSVAVTGSALVWQQGMPLPQAYANIFWGMSVIVVAAIICSFVYLSSRRAA
ncbi:MAG: transporter [Paenibacillus sp.]|jgi:DHA2 family metal-tetracycline-proton antiporter-like MFS transporter|nr:transporter [Paenibacillus sp.]